MPIRKGTSHQYKSQQKQFVWQKQCPPVNFSFFFYIICIYQYFINRIRRGVVIKNSGYLMKSLGHLGIKQYYTRSLLIIVDHRFLWVLPQHMNITLRMVKYFYISYYKLTSLVPNIFFHYYFRLSVSAFLSHPRESFEYHAFGDSRANGVLLNDRNYFKVKANMDNPRTIIITYNNIDIFTAESHYLRKYIIHKRTTPSERWELIL